MDRQGRPVRCYRGLPADSPDCCLRRNCHLRLDKIECALADEFTRARYLDFLRRVGNEDHVLYANAYVLLNDYTGASPREHLVILLQVKGLISDLPLVPWLERAWHELGRHNAQEFLPGTQQALVEELTSSFRSFVQHQIMDMSF